MKVVLLLVLLVKATGAAELHRVVRSADANGIQKITLEDLAAAGHLNTTVEGFRLDHHSPVVNHKGTRRGRVIQTFHDLDVYGVSAEVEIDGDGGYTGHIYGHVARYIGRDIQDPQACERVPPEMVNIALMREGIDVDDKDIDDTEVKRIVYVNRTTEAAYLAYTVGFFYAGHSHVSNPFYIIEACSSLVILKYNKISNGPIISNNRINRRRNLNSAFRRMLGPPQYTCTPYVAGVGGNTKIGKIYYNRPPRHCLEPTIQGDLCTMENDYAKVYSRRVTAVVHFFCTSGYRDAVNGAFGVANDAFHFGTLLGKFYQEKYDLTLSDIISIIVHYRPRRYRHQYYANAFWYKGRLYFGDGSFSIFPLVSADITSHEYAHGLINEYSKLEYENQSGGLNEGFADIAGETFEHYVKGKNDWKVGSDIFKSWGGVIRHLDNPTLDGVSIKHLRDYTDEMNVHFSSGIINHAFYQMVKVERMTIYDAFRCFLEANELLWEANTGFEEGACSVLQICQDNGYDCNKVRRAFEKVGINFETCDQYALTSVMKQGGNSRNVLISKTQKAIFKLNLDQNPQLVNITTENSHSKMVKLKLSSHASGRGLLAKGKNCKTFKMDSLPEIIYLTLSTKSKKGVRLTLTVG